MEKGGASRSARAAVPALPDQQAPTQFITVAGTQVPLPGTARPDLAYLYTYGLNNAVSYSGFALTVPGDAYEIPVNLHINVATPGTGGARSFTFIHYDGNGNIIHSVPTSALQPISTTYQYDFFVGSGLAYGPVGNAFFLTLPVMFGNPGDQWTPISSVVASNSTWTSQAFQVIRIPTGPSPSRPEPVVADLQLT